MGVVLFCDLCRMTLHNIWYSDVLMQAGQRPFFSPQMQQVRPRWQPMQPQQQQVRPLGMQGIPGGGQVPCARGMRQAPPRGVPGQQPQSTGSGGASQCLGMGQPPQVRRRFGGMQAQRQPFKFGQNVRKTQEAVSVLRAHSVKEKSEEIKN